MSDADRWAIVERIYHEAVERPVAERAAFLESACAGDDALRHEVESLLANDGASLLDRSALDVAAREMAQQVTPSWVGRTIRNYEILALLGAVGWARSIARATRSLGREVALKLLPREVSRDPERLRRLEREARMLAALNHPSIATLYGLEEHDGQRFLVMELVPGQTLAERLRHGAAPDSRRARHLSADCRGTRGRARRGHRPSRPEAGKHQGHSRRTGEAAGLWPGKGAATRSERSRTDAWRRARRREREQSSERRPT